MIKHSKRVLFLYSKNRNSEYQVLGRKDNKMGKMGLKEFKEIAEYANTNWARNSFTKEEEKECAEIYYADFKWSKRNDCISDTIKSLCKNLADDVEAMSDLEEPKQWLYSIASELGLLDMDCMDYLDTDAWVKEFI